MKLMIAAGTILICLSCAPYSQSQKIPFGQGVDQERLDYQDKEVVENELDPWVAKEQDMETRRALEQAIERNRN